MLKRFFDILLSIFALILLFPILLVISILIIIDSKGPILYKQQRVGKTNQDFTILKFRTMYLQSDKQGLLTVGNNDKRITRMGYFLRKYKIDELPQLINILKGDMSFVGPRPEVRKYVNLYTQEQLIILSIRPGLTDYASIEYSNENELLASSIDPEQTYINDIMPTKLGLNMQYIQDMNFITDIKLILRTISKIIKTN